MGAYAEHAEALIKRGYGAIPIMAGTKVPGFFCAGMWVPLTAWEKRYLQDHQPSDVDLAAWSRGDAGIGVVGGKSSHGLVGVDIDTDDLAIKTAITLVLPDTPVRKVGHKGETKFYYGPDVPSRSWNINHRRVCDIIADGRQTVLPPTIHEKTGLPYRWVGPPLNDFAPKDLPFLPADVIDAIDAALAPLGWKPESIKAGNGGASFDMDAGDTPHRQLNEFALEHLERWVAKLGLYKCRKRPDGGGYAAVAHWRESSTGRPLNVRKRNLSIHPTGIKDFGDGRNGGDGFTYTPLDLVMAANDCDLDTAFKFLSDHTGWASEQVVLVDAAAVLGPTTPAPAAEPTPAIEASPAVEPTPVLAAEATTETPAPIDELDPYTRNVPGVIGDVIEWILATARRPNRVLALAAAIPLVGTLIGRRVAGPTMSATHLYTIAVAPTGAGKQHPIDCIGNLLVAAGAQEHLGSGRFMSASALCNFVTRKPLSLCCSDEIGAFLAKVTAKGASGHEREISSVLRSLWGVSFTVHPMPEWASREAQQVHTPGLSVFGTSTSDELFQALQGESIDNGLLSRFLVLSSRLRTKDTTPQLLTKEVPPELANRCRGLYHWYDTDVELIDIKRPVEQQVTQLHWADAAAEKEYLDFARMIDDRIDQDPALRPFLIRAAETAIRLATIRAVGIGYQSATVTVDDVYWGAGIAWLTGQRLYTGTQTAVPETDRSRWIKRILDRIRAGNLKKKKVNVRYLQQRLGRYLKAKDIKEIVAEMVGLDLLRQELDGTLVIIMELGDED
jgi:hypothetical protein